LKRKKCHFWRPFAFFFRTILFCPTFFPWNGYLISTLYLLNQKECFDFYRGFKYRPTNVWSDMKWSVFLYFQLFCISQTYLYIRYFFNYIKILIKTVTSFLTTLCSLFFRTMSVNDSGNVTCPERATDDEVSISLTF